MTPRLHSGWLLTGGAACALVTLVGAGCTGRLTLYEPAGAAVTDASAEAAPEADAGACRLADAWTTIDEVVDRYPWVVAEDSSGRLYHAGQIVTGRGSVYVRRSDTGGATWVDADTLVVAGYRPIKLFGLATADRTVLAAFSAEGDGGRLDLIRRSEDEGRTWTTQAFQPSSSDLVADASGHLHLLGTVPGTDLLHWLVQTSTDKGLTFTTTGDFAPAADSSSAEAFVVSAAGAYACGLTTPRTGPGHWIVRSKKGDVTQTADDFVSGNAAACTGLVETRGGALLASGYAGSNDNPTHAIIRRRAPNQDTWTTVDDFEPPGAHIRGALTMTVDRAGAIYFGLDAIGSDLKFHSLLRRSTDDGLTWTTFDDFVGLGGKPFVDRAGNLLVGANIVDQDGRAHGVLRRRDCIR